MNSGHRSTVPAIASAIAAILSLAASARAQTTMETTPNYDLALKLQNPVADLMSVRLQNDIDFGFVPSDGFRDTLDVEPVIPIPLTTEWNLISRTIAPVIFQHDVRGNSDEQFGLGDLTESLFLSPVTQVHGLFFGVGPAFVLPIATEDMLGNGKWSIGPTAAVVQQRGGCTLGVLANHVWSFAGENDRADVSTTYIQPFLAYTLPQGTTFVVNSETSIDWIGDDVTMPINGMVTQVLTLGGQPISVGAGGRYYFDSPPGGSDWGVRMEASLLFPR